MYTKVIVCFGRPPQNPKEIQNKLFFHFYNTLSSCHHARKTMSGFRSSSTVFPSHAAALEMERCNCSTRPYIRVPRPCGKSHATRCCHRSRHFLPPRPPRSSTSFCHNRSPQKCLGEYPRMSLASASAYETWEETK